MRVLILLDSFARAVVFCSSARGCSPLTRVLRAAVYLSSSVLSELKRIVVESEVMKEDDSQWPPPDSNGRQELEVVLGDEHISFVTTKIGSLVDLEGSKDAEGTAHEYTSSRQANEQADGSACAVGTLSDGGGHSR